jgi:hypothetical protein
MPEKKKTPPADKKTASKQPPPKAVPDTEDAGQATIFNVPPSAFERLVDDVLKKHKL